nr:UPF0505 protein isoform X3 [Ipomoea trifida]
MELNFRDRDYRGEAEAHALPRVPAAIHPLSTPSPPHHQGDVADYGKDDFFDPLRRHDVKADASSKDLPDEVKSLKSLSEVSPHLSEKEWTSFRNFLMKRFPISRMISISSMSGSIMKSAKGNEKQSTNVHLEELEDPDTFAEEEIKVISHREYVSHLYELKDEINHAWKADNRVASLKLSIKDTIILKKGYIRCSHVLGRYVTQDVMFLSFFEDNPFFRNSTSVSLNNSVIEDEFLKYSISTSPLAEFIPKPPTAQVYSW